MDLEVVYKATPESVTKVMRVLRKNGCNPAVIDNPSPTSLYTAKGTLLIRIAVPKEEVNKAKAALTNWEKEVKPNVDKLSAKFFTQLVYSILLTLAIVAILFLLGLFSIENIPLILLIWFISLAVIANAKKFWKK